MPNYMQVGPGSYVPSGRPRVEPRPQPLGPPYEPGQDVMTENAAVAGSPFRQYLEEQFNRSREQGPPQFAPPPELAPINFEEIRGALKGIEHPEMKRGPMTPEERKAFLFEWGLRSLGASGQPRASFAGAIGTGGVGALESHRGRRREDYDVSADRADRSRRGIVDDYSMQKDRYSTEERAAAREQERRMAEEEARRQHEMALIGMAGDMMQFDQRAAPHYQWQETGDGVVAYNPQTGTARPVPDAQGNPLRPAASRGGFAHDSQKQMALAMLRPKVESGEMTPQEADVMASQIALRLYTPPEEAYAARRKIGADLLSVAYGNVDRAKQLERELDEIVRAMEERERAR